VAPGAIMVGGTFIDASPPAVVLVEGCDVTVPAGFPPESMAAVGPPGRAGVTVPVAPGGSRSGLMHALRQSAPAHAITPSMRAVFCRNFRSMLTRASMISKSARLPARTPLVRFLHRMC
jgi:hypothetical protein